ncbi:Aldo-keto reductase family 1 member B1 [Pseudolycoriella hygida]|uniref:Aldo-keto reductase family 1 member B1 n=1 Tax=Pseudolycoriella hygida TaxID=35572 RepID=A0A9Q0MT90_9DIPT|nr:Aldo-keto reductase family 1 member B1 [Pseudolycoriella hygida]
MELLIPNIGFGTTSTDQERYGQVATAVNVAIDMGYRYFETSKMYGNEIEIGLAFAKKMEEKVVKRNDLIIANKFWCTYDDSTIIENSCRQSLEKLKLNYFDIFFLHIPSRCIFKGEEQLFPLYSEPSNEMRDIDYVKAWKTLEHLVEIGLTRTIGVANCTENQLQRVLNEATTPPKIVYIECCPGLHQKKLITYCKRQNILVSAYCPLNRPDFQAFAESYNNHIGILEICQKYKKTSSQLILRYLYQLGTIPIPKSITPSRMGQYINIFDFELTDKEMNLIDSFYIDERSIDLEQGLNQQFPLKRKKIPISSKCKF